MTWATVEKWAGRVSALTLLGGALLWAMGELPKKVKPASEHYVDQKVEPVQRSTNNSDYQIAVEGIAWAKRETGKGVDSEHTPEYIQQQLCGSKLSGFEGYFRIYQRVTGHKHPTEKTRCDGGQPGE